MSRAVIAHASASRVGQLARRLLRYVALGPIWPVPIQGKHVHVVRGLVDNESVALGQTNLRELDRAGQMEDLERQALEREHLQPCVLGDEEAAALAYGHAGEPPELAGGGALAAKGAAEGAIQTEDHDAMVLRVGNEEL